MQNFLSKKIGSKYFDKLSVPLWHREETCPPSNSIQHRHQQIDAQALISLKQIYFGNQQLDA